MLLHKVIKGLGLEKWVADKAASSAFFRSCVPFKNNFTDTEEYHIKRAGVSYQLAPADFMQWVLFANHPSDGVEYAVECIDKNSVVIDVGASIGGFSLEIAAAIKQQKISGSSVLSFEPNPYSVGRFKQNQDLNLSFSSLVELKEVALSNHKATAVLNYNPTNSGGSSLLVNDSHNKKVDVEVSFLDDYMDSIEGKDVVFIKIDAEGLEPLVVLGAEAIIDNHRPTLFIEFSDVRFKKIGYSSRWLVDWLEAKGYSLFLDGEKGLEPFQSLMGDSVVNVLCRPIAL